MLNKKYSILSLFLFLNILNQIDRNILASFAPQISEELSLSHTEFGLLTGVFFAVFYSLAGLFMGIAADRYNRPRLIAAGLFVWSALTAASGVARSFVEMAAARMLVSVGESSLVPAATSLLADKFPPYKRATVMGVFFTGIPLGLGGSYLVAGLLGPILGWRGVFLTLGLAGILLTLVMLFVKDPVRGALEAGTKKPEPSGDEDASPSIPQTCLLLWKTVRNNSTLAYVIMGIIAAHFFYAGQSFSQLWLVHELGFDAVEIVTIYGAITLVAGTAGSLLGGMLCDWYCNRFAGSRAGFILLVSGIFGPFMLIYRFVEPGSFLFYACMTSGFLFITSIYGSIFSLLQDESPIKMRATVVGATMLSLTLVAMGLGSVVLGFSSDTMIGLGFDKPLTAVLFGSDVLALLCVPCFYRVLRLKKGQKADPDNFSKMASQAAPGD